MNNFRVNFAFILVMISSLLVSNSAFATDLRVGDTAPNFVMQGTDGKSYDLASFKGKQAVVLAWYPMASTRGCTIECKSLTEKGHLIREFNVSYFMASVDEIDKNKTFANEQKANFPLLSDPKKKAAKAYDVLNVFGVASRVTFYIGKNGKILHIDEDVKPKTSAEDIASNLAKVGVDKA